MNIDEELGIDVVVTLGARKSTNDEKTCRGDACPLMQSLGEFSNNGSNASDGRLGSSKSSHGNLDSGMQMSHKRMENVDIPPIFNVSCSHSSHVDEELRAKK